MSWKAAIVVSVVIVLVVGLIAAAALKKHEVSGAAGAAGLGATAVGMFLVLAYRDERRRRDDEKT